MPRSRDPRDKLPSQRGAKRTGPIGTILPGDDYEVARDIQRIWFEIQRFKRCPCGSGLGWGDVGSGSTGPGTPGGGGGGDGTIPGGIGGGYQEAVIEHPCLAHYWTVGSGDDSAPLGSLAMDRFTHVVPSQDPHNPGATSPSLDGWSHGFVGVLYANTGRFQSAGGMLAIPTPWTVEINASLEDYGHIVFPADEDPTYGGACHLLNIGTLSGSSLDIQVGGSESLLVQTYSGGYVDSGVPFTAGHLVVTCDGTTLSVYLNGGLIGSDAVIGSSGLSGGITWLNLPSGAAALAAPWNGTSTDLAIYNCLMTVEDIDLHGELSGMAG